MRAGRRAPARVELIAVGSELTGGERLDTNTLWLRRQLGLLDVEVRRVTSVPDHPAELQACLEAALAGSDLVVMTGGLGPTEDDRTLEALSRAVGRGQRLSPEVVAWLERRRGRPLGPEDESWLRQARLPEEAVPLANARGTAPGVMLEAGGCLVVALPGVPDEMQGLWQDHLAGALRARFGPVPGSRRHLVVGGRRESEVDDLAAPLCRRHGAALTTLAGGGVVELLLSGTGSAVAAAAEALATTLGDDLVSDDGRSLEQVVLDAARARGGMLAVAESCTGGRVAARLTAVPGASQAFAGGVVAYSDDLKRRLLGVADATLAVHGAVSEATALEMAAGLEPATGCRWGVAVTGIAGPDGGGPDKPVGTVWMAARGPAGPVARRLRLPGGRERVQHLAAGVALDLLRRAVLQGGAA